MYVIVFIPCIAAVYGRVNIRYTEALSLVPGIQET